MSRFHFDKHILQSLSGAVYPDAIVSFFNQISGTPVPLYNAYSGGSSFGISQTSDSNGRINCFVDPGLYRIEVRDALSVLLYQQTHILCPASTSVINMSNVGQYIVTLTNPSSDQLIKVDSSGIVSYIDVPSTISSISDIEDVLISSLTTNQILMFNGTDWVNHTLTKSDIGLSNVDNTSDIDKPISTATQNALYDKSDTTHIHTLDSLSGVVITNPDPNDVLKYDGFKWVESPLTKSDVGLSNVDNTSDIDKPISTATQTALDGKASSVQGAKADSAVQPGDNISDLVNDAGYITSVGGLDGLSDVVITTATNNDFLKFDGTNWVNVPITKSSVGLSNVDNTSDVNKPVSTATQTALDSKSDTSHSHTLDNLSDVAITSASKGDLLVNNGTSFLNLVVGTNDYVLTADSTTATGVKWAAAPSGGGGGGGGGGTTTGYLYAGTVTTAPTVNGNAGDDNILIGDGSAINTTASRSKSVMIGKALTATGTGATNAGGDILIGSDISLTSNSTNFGKNIIIGMTYTVNFTSQNFRDNLSVGNGHTTFNAPSVITESVNLGFTNRVGDQGVSVGGFNTGVAFSYLFGKNNTASGNFDVLMGYSNTGNSSTYGTAVGISNTVGTNSVAVGRSNMCYSSNNVAVGYNNNIRNYNDNSISIGYNNAYEVRTYSSVATTCGMIGSSNIIKSTGEVGGGGTPKQNMFCFGVDNRVRNSNSHVHGLKGMDHFPGEQTFSSGGFSTHGDSKISRAVFRALTTNNTPTDFATNMDQEGFTTTPSGPIFLANNSTWIFDVNIVARNTTTNGQNAAFNVKFVCKQDESFGTGAFIGTPVITTLGADVGASTWAVSVDMSYGYPRIIATGESGKTIRWVANISATAVTE